MFSLRLQEAIDALGLTRTTVERYRKTLGIFDETKDGVTESQLEDMRKLRDRRGKRASTDNISFPVHIDPPKSSVYSGEGLKIESEDPVAIKNLKIQYNNNLKIINYLTSFVTDQIEDKVVPEKYLIDSVERYQKLNMQTLTTIKKVSPTFQEENKSSQEVLMGAIQERLNGYQ